MTTANNDSGGLYIHVPFCRVVCPYCDFAVVRDRNPSLHRDWSARMAYALMQLPPPFALRSIYIGGGTPSRLDPLLLASLLAQWSGDAVCEVTLEANPEDISSGRLERWRAAGVNRLSIGVQRLDRDGLRRLGRGASRGAVEELPERLQQWRRLGGTASVDLIYGLPGDDPRLIAEQVCELLAWPVDHLSAYALTIEPATPFGRAAARGRTLVAEDDRIAAIYLELLAVIEAAGWDAYEVSSFCRPGHRAVHNSGYWERRPYLGHGPGAASLLCAAGAWTRSTRWRNIDTWLADPLGCEVQEVLDAARECAETLLVGLRSDVGVPQALLTPFRAARGALVERLFETGVLEYDGARVRMPPAARLRAEAVAAAWLQTLRAEEEPKH